MFNNQLPDWALQLGADPDEFQRFIRGRGGMQPALTPGVQGPGVGTPGMEAMPMPAGGARRRRPQVNAGPGMGQRPPRSGPSVNAAPGVGVRPPQSSGEPGRIPPGGFPADGGGSYGGPPSGPIRAEAGPTSVGPERRDGSGAMPALPNGSRGPKPPSLQEQLDAGQVSVADAVAQHTGQDTSARDARRRANYDRQMAARNNRQPAPTSAGTGIGVPAPAPVTDTMTLPPLTSSASPTPIPSAGTGVTPPTGGPGPRPIAPSSTPPMPNPMTDADPATMRQALMKRRMQQGPPPIYQPPL